VLSHKHQNTEVKYRHMKDMLAKKFKRENEMAVNMKANAEDNQTRILIKLDKVMENQERKKTQD
jgi:hypothetical protein